MKFVTLQVAKTKPNGVTEEAFKAAKKLGEIECSYATAIDNVALSKGLYEIKPEEVENVEVVVQALKDPEEMSNQELYAEMASHGKPPRKKMNHKDVVKFVNDLRAKAENFIVDDEDEGDEQ